jgi:hypothetical protein
LIVLISSLSSTIINLANAQPANTVTLQWSKDCNGSKVSKVIETSDGGYAIIWLNNSNQDRRISLDKVDSSGKLMWTKTYGSTGVIYTVNALVQTNDSGFVFCYQGANSELSGSGGLLKTNSNGEVEWNKSISVKVGYASFTSLIQTSDLGFAISSRGSFWNMSGFAGLLKTDSQGNTIWTKIYTGASLGLTPSVWADSVIQTSNGNYVLVGAGGKPDGWFAETDSTGELKISKTYDYGDFTSISSTKNGDYILVGFSGEGDGWLQKIDSSGNIIWKNFHKGFTLQSVRELADGTYITAGSTSNAFFAQFDASGNLLWNWTNPVQYPSAALTTSQGFAVASSEGGSVHLESYVLTSQIPPSPSSSVPEFSWLTILPLLLAIPTALIIVRKRMQRNI